MARSKKITTPNKVAKKPDPLDDTNTQEDGQAVVGHFVKVIAGDHEGRYGVLIGDAAGDTVIVRTRDDDSARIVVKYTDLAPALSGER